MVDEEEEEELHFQGFDFGGSSRDELEWLVEGRANRLQNDL
jgi:hypothetical protein